MFDDVRFEDSYAASYYKIDDIELPTNSGHEYENGNLAHRPRAKGGYFPVAPVDSAQDIRADMVSTMIEMGLPMDKHHTRSPRPTRARHDVRQPRQDRRTACRSTICSFQMVAQPMQDRDPQPKPVKSDNGAACTPTSLSGRRQPPVRRQRLCGLSETCSFHRRRSSSTQGAQRITNRTPTAISASSQLRGARLIAYSSRTARAAHHSGAAKRPNASIPLSDAAANPYLPMPPS